MRIINCSTQAELNKALTVHGSDIQLIGAGIFEISGSSQVMACDSSQVTAYGSSQVRAYSSSRVTACDSSQVTAYGSSQVMACDSSQVTAYGSSQVTACGSSRVTACDSSQVTAYGSSQVIAYSSSRVTAYGSSQVRAYDSSQVTAYGSSQVTACGSSQVRAYDSSQVRAYDSSQVMACDSSQVTATKYVAVTKTAKTAKTTWRGMTKTVQVKVKGGVLIELPTITTAKEWCEFYGVTVTRGIATLFKALNADFTSLHGISYAPNTTPAAPDWDGGETECGGGLHFSPHPFMALKFHNEAKKFVACPVLLKEIVVYKNATYPDKVKAPRVYKPCYEVSIDGDRIFLS